MVTKEEAIKIVRDTLPEDEDVLLDSVIERENGWVIFYQTKEYIKTTNPMAMVSSGGILVEKATGRAFEFGYDLGFLQRENRDIVIIKGINMRKTTKHLMKLGICYVVPEKEYNAVWKTYPFYTYRQIKHKLKSLPVRFNLGYVDADCCEVLESFKEQSDFEYQLFENKGYENSI